MVQKVNLYSKKVRGVGDIINVENLVLGQYIRLILYQFIRFIILFKLTMALLNERVYFTQNKEDLSELCEWG